MTIADPFWKRRPFEHAEGHSIDIGQHRCPAVCVGSVHNFHPMVGSRVVEPAPYVPHERRSWTDFGGSAR